jgi:hypothetical protein
MGFSWFLQHLTCRGVAMSDNYGADGKKPTGTDDAPARVVCVWGKPSMSKVVLLAVILVAGASPDARPDGAKHTVKVTFDYNFTVTPACSERVKDKCVKQFVVYDISAGTDKRTKLFTIPVDPSAKGSVKGITGTSSLLLFEPGKHLISVVAETPSNLASDLNACTTWIQIE